MALMVFLAVLGGLWAAAATALAGGGNGGGGSSTIQITQCPSSSSSTTPTNTTSCQQTTATLAPAPPPHHSSTTSTTSTPAPPPGSEVHSYSLSNGKGTVTTRTGNRYGDTAKVQIAPGASAPAPKPANKAPGAGTPPGQAAPAPPPLPPVSTNGGSGFGGLGAGLSIVSADQALSQFEIPSFLLPIYLAAGRTYGVPWPVLAGINKIESDFGRNMSTSSAGAVGWMQFMPATWKGYAVDANGDGYADPYDPADAIFAAARYLHNAGASTNLRQAIFAYNHAGWYVDEVLQTASVYGSLPPGLVSVTGSLAYGRFPLLGPSSYGDDFRLAQLAGHRPQPLQIHSRGGASAVATQQVKVTRILLAPALAADLKLHGLPASVPATSGPVAPGSPSPASPSASGGPSFSAPVDSVVAGAVGDVLSAVGGFLGGPAPITNAGRLDAAPAAPVARVRGAALPPGFGVTRTPGITVIVTDADGDHYSYGGLSAIPAYVRPGAQLAGGETLGTLPSGPGAALAFSVTAAGGTPVDPRSLVDGYRLQEAVHFYRAVAPFGANPFVPQSVSSRYGGYVSPFQGYTPIAERIDMGVDYSAPPGSPLVAIGAGRVIGFSPNWYAGQPLVDYQLTSGPLAGVDVYYAEQLTPLVSAGQTVSAGQVIGRVASSGTGLELGFGTSVPGQTLAQVTGGYGEGALTMAGQAFSNLMLELGAPPGLAEGRPAVGDPINMPSLSGVRAGAASGLGAVSPGPASAAQEAAISRALDRISNPKLAKPSPYAVRVGRDRPAPRPSAGGAPLGLVPSAAGASLTAVSAPSGATGGAAWATGTVDGTLHPGWARSQTVLMHFGDGTWSIAGAPRDASGRVVNPRLRALSVTADGSGYAVGDHGAIVELGAGHAPTLLPSRSAARLAAVAVAGSASALRGVAVGARGSVVELAGAGQRWRTQLAGRPDLTGATIDRQGAVLAGTGPAGPALYRDAGGAVQPLPLHLGLPAGTQVELRSVAERAGELWLAGGLMDPTGVAAETPFGARQAGGGWQTFCESGPSLAGVVEVGTPTPSVCAGTLPIGAHAGPASAISLPAQGAVLATPDGLLLDPTGGGGFSPVCATGCSGDLTSVGLAANGAGWALDRAGGVSRVVAGDRGALPGTGQRTPQPGAPGASAIVAASAAGDRALSVTPEAASALSSGRWHAARAPGVALRRLALVGAGQGWAVAESGALLHYVNGGWSEVGGGSLRSAGALTRSLGGAPLSSAGRPLRVGLNGLGFASPGDGYAVGGNGLILHYDGTAWKPERSGVSKTLTDVAAGPGGAIAVGREGTLLEHRRGGWVRSQQASSLVGGQDFAAAGALPDGTLLAFAGGSAIIRSPRRQQWTAALVAPLGSTPLRLGAYRDPAGRLHLLALLVAGEADVVLDGDASGWRPLAVPNAMQVSDLLVDESGKRVWLAGQSGDEPVTTELPLTSQRVAANLAGPTAAGSPPAPSPAAAPPATPPASGTAKGSSVIGAASSLVTQRSLDLLGAVGL